MEQINILVVDDEKRDRGPCRDLSGHEYKVFKANNAKEAGDPDQEEIHLVLLDIMMPNGRS